MTESKEDKAKTNVGMPRRNELSTTSEIHKQNWRLINDSGTYSAEIAGQDWNNQRWTMAPRCVTDYTEKDIALRIVDDPIGRRMLRSKADGRNSSRTSLRNGSPRKRMETSTTMVREVRYLQGNR